MYSANMNVVRKARNIFASTHWNFENKNKKKTRGSEYGSLKQNSAARFGRLLVSRVS